MKERRKTTGGRNEWNAAVFLKEQGLTIIEMNYRCRSGEIDIIALDGNTLVFVEVRSRSVADMEAALESISGKKAAQVRRIAEIYLYTHQYPEETLCRFDAIGIAGNELAYIKNAF